MKCRRGSLKGWVVGRPGTRSHTSPATALDGAQRTKVMTAALETGSGRGSLRRRKRNPPVAAGDEGVVTERKPPDLYWPEAGSPGTDSPEAMAGLRCFCSASISS